VDFAFLDAYPPLMVKEEVTTVLRCDPRTVDRLVARGLLRALKPGRGGSARVLFAREELARYLGQMAGSA
jgi:excisionase family DNA binding protein